MVIKKNELRIGNLLEFHGQIRPITAYEIYKLADGACFDEYPILLTEDLLLRMGFKRHIPSGGNLPVYYINYEGTTVLGYWLIDGAVNIGDFIPHKIKYVHQLQNLYFALTGDELVGF